MCYFVMSHVQIGYVLVGIIIVYLHVLIAAIDNLSLIKLCLILFENLLYCVCPFDPVYCAYNC